MTAEDYKSLQGFIMAMTKGRIDEDARGDILQDALIACLDKGIDPMSAMARSYMVVHIMRHRQLVSRKYKTAVKHPVCLSEAGTSRSKQVSVEDAAILQEDVNLMRMHIAALPPSLRETIRLHLAGCTTVEVAAVRKVTQQTVAKDRCRALTKLQESYGVARPTVPARPQAVEEGSGWDYDGRVWLTGDDDQNPSEGPSGGFVTFTG